MASTRIGSGALWALVAALLVATSGSAQEAAAPESEAAAPLEQSESAASAGDAKSADSEAGPGKDAAESPEREVLLRESKPRGEMTEGVEEIVITGVPLDTLQETPVSSTTFSAEEVEGLRVQTIGDLADYTPNLEINTAFAASNPTLFIRGIGLKDYNANAAGAVAVYQDGIYINSPAGQLFQIFDVESVRVLRGPQGTTNGRNATAGAIIVESRKPDGTFNSEGSVSYGRFNTIELRGGVGFPIPLFGEALSGRIAGVWNYADGYVKNACAGKSLAQVVDPVTAEISGGIKELPCFAQAFPAYERVPNPKGTKFINKKLEDGNCDPTLQPSQSTPERPACPLVPRTFNVKDEQNNTRNWATRGMLRFQPTDTQDWLLNFHWGQNRGDSFHLVSCGQQNSPANPEFGLSALSEFEAMVSCNGQNAAGFQRPPGSSPWTGFYDRDGKEKLDLLGTSLTGHWDLGAADFLGPVSLVTISGYEENQREVGDEGDGAPTNLFSAIWRDDAWQVSQELRFQGTGDNYTWIAGGYFLHEELEADNFFTDGTQTDFQQFFDQTLWNFAPFASLRYDFFNGLSLEGGIRYNWEKKEFTLLTEAFTRSVQRDVAFREEETVGDTWTGVTGDFTLSYAPVESLTTYAKYSRGMKGGHFNAGATSEEQVITPTDPEFIHAVEVGAKGGLFDGLFQFSLAGFRYWYTDLQVFDIVNEVGKSPTQQLLNSDARVLGAELEFQATPLPGLFLRGAGAWLDSEFVDFVVTKRVRPPPEGPGSGCGAICAQDETFNYSGHPLIAAPEWSAFGLVEYTLELPRNWGAIVPHFDFSWRSKQYTDPSKAEIKRCRGCPIESLNDGILSQPAYWLLNARLAYRWEGFELAGWVQNLTDEAYLIDSFDLRQNLGMTLQVYGRPRTYGLTLSYSF